MKNFFTSVGKFFKHFFLYILIAIVALVVYYVFNPSKAITLVFPDLSQISYVNAVFKEDSALTDIYVVLQNKNPYKLSIDSIHFEVKLNDTLIAKESIALNLKQSRFDADTVKLPLNLNF